MSDKEKTCPLKFPRTYRKKKKKKSKWFTYNGDEWASDNLLFKWVINQKCKTFPNSSIADVRNCCLLCGKLNILRFCLLLRSKRETNHVYNLSLNIHIVGGRKRWVMKWGLLIISWYQCVYTFMPVPNVLSCMVLYLYAVFACVFEFYLRLKKKDRAPRPAASWSNWQVNHVSAGTISVCVCLWKMHDLSREAVCDRGSPVLLTLMLTTGKRTEFPSAERRQAAKNPSHRAITLSRLQVKHFSMCVVMRSCVFVWDLSVSGLLPLVC